MTGAGSPCGACKFLRRKCVTGCVFAPYFCHEQGASVFSAIHRVFGASNVSKMLSHLPVSERFEAAMTISYEAQARVEDPIYGCVSHIFALQQQDYAESTLISSHGQKVCSPRIRILDVVNLQAQLALLIDQSAQNNSNSSHMENPSLKFSEKSNHLQSRVDYHTRSQSELSNRMPELYPNLTSNACDSTTIENYENSLILGESISSKLWRDFSFDSIEFQRCSGPSINSFP